MRFKGLIAGVLLLFISGGFLSLPAHSQTVRDTISLVPQPPDTVMTEVAGSDVLVRWYPSPDSISAVVGSFDFSNWYSYWSMDEVSVVDIHGAYTGDIDRIFRVQRLAFDTVTVGVDEMLFRMTTDDKFNYYSRLVRLDSDYTPGDKIPCRLVNEEDETDTLDLGIDISFSSGVVGSSLSDGPAFFLIDLQDFEGFHIWRGLSPYPGDMEIVQEISKEDAFIGVDEDSLFFLDNPKYDETGEYTGGRYTGKYYEWRDSSVFVGFTYYYTVTCYDRGFFRGFFQHNKWDSYICEDSTFVYYYDSLGVERRDCENVARPVTMTVNPGDRMREIYAVPNPYRTGSSANTTPYYHNFPDRAVKFFNMPPKANFRIYTVSGDLVWETEYSAPEGKDGVLSWDVKNIHGQNVSSGVYIYRCERDDGDSMYGRLVIIR